MNLSQINTLLMPRQKSIFSRTREPGALAKPMIMGGLGILFWAGALAVCLRVLGYVSRVPELGDLLAWKLLSIMMVTLFSLLVYSAILNALSRLYLARDLDLVHALPVPSHRILAARWVEIYLDSSWMVILYSLPLLTAYGIIYSPPVYYVPVMLISLMLLGAIASLLGTMAVMILVMIVPAGRIRTLFIFLGLLLFILLYMGLRMVRPEQLVDPEGFSAALFYMKSMAAPSSPFLPSTWCYDVVMAALGSCPFEALFHLGLMGSFVLLMLHILAGAGDLMYAAGVSRSRSTDRRVRTRQGRPLPLTRRLSGPVRALVERELRTFFRDQSQWSQLFLIAALMVIYIYNFKVLPLDRAPIRTVYLQNLLAFLNMGLAFFVLTAIAGRFAFPAVSMEGEAIWIVRSAPISSGRFLRVKFLFYLVPLLLLTLILVLVTNTLLKVTPFMMVLSVVDTLLVVPGVLALAVGLGGAYPVFTSENPTQVVTSFGGLLFMIASAVFIAAVLILQAGPVYILLMAHFRETTPHIGQWFWIILCFALSFLISILVVVLALKTGSRRLDRFLFR